MKATATRVWGGAGSKREDTLLPELVAAERSEEDRGRRLGGPTGEEQRES